jgi:signal transduction histidine kinase
MGLRARLLLLVLLPTIPALLLALYTDLEQRRFGTAKAAKEAFRVVQVVAGSQSGLIETTRRHLLGLTQFPQARGHNTSSFESFFTTMRKVYSDYTDLGIVETNGAVISSSFGLKGVTNILDQPHFQRVLRLHDLVVGDFQPASPLIKASLPVAYPLLDEEKRLIRVLYAALDLDALNRVLAQVPVPEGGVAEVFDSKGRLLARYPDPQKWAGKSCGDSPLFATISARLEGTADMPGLDGAPRLQAFTTIRCGGEPGLFVNVGIPASLAYSETTRILVINLAILGAVAFLALVAAWIYADRYILHPLSALLSSTRRLTSGDLSARVGISHGSAEFQLLAQAFDEMAASLQQQGAEMDRSNEMIRRLNTNLENRVTERTAQLEGLNRQLEAFSYSVSHDLRAPLRHIGAYLQLLQKESGSSFTNEGRRFLEQIAGSLARMHALIEDLLAFARTSRAEMRRENVAMSELVSEVRREMKRDIEGRDIQWEIDPLPQVFADRAMLKQVWANLLSNAVKYTRERRPAQIKIGCQRHETELEFYVRDNGAGFDMKYAAKLFGVFQRLHSADKFEGTGIGLANVHRIIARHGGRTWAEGMINQGATFHFTLWQRTAELDAADRTIPTA